VKRGSKVAATLPQYLITKYLRNNSLAFESSESATRAKHRERIRILPTILSTREKNSALFERT
jgi:hypothetical protein